MKICTSDTSPPPQPPRNELNKQETPQYTIDILVSKDICFIPSKPIRVTGRSFTKEIEETETLAKFCQYLSKFKTTDDIGQTR